MNKKMLGICLAAAVISTGTLGGVVASEVADRSLLGAKAEIDTSGSTYGDYRFWFGSNKGTDYFFDGTNYLTIGIDVYENGVSGSAVYSAEYDPSEYLRIANQCEEGEEKKNPIYYAIDIDAKYASPAYDFEIRRVYNNETTDWSGRFHLDTLNQVLYLFDNNGWMKGHSFGTVSSCESELAAAALEGLYTCSSSEINGYGAFEEIGKTFLWNNDYVSKVNGSLSEVTIKDYANNAAWQDPTTERSTDINSLVKYDALRALSGLAEAPNLN